MTCGWTGPAVNLNPEQKREIKGELSKLKRSPVLRDPNVQEMIIQRIEGALTKLSNDRQGPLSSRSVDRLERLAKGETIKLHEAEQELIDLLATGGNKSLEEMAQTAANSLKIGRGEKYGKLEENKTRFLADQLADLFEIGLNQRAGHGDKSAFRKLLDIVCGEVDLPRLSRDAVQAITEKYR